MSKMSYFRTPFNSQLGNGSLKLLKSARQHFYPIAVSLRYIELENVSFSQIWNLRTVCWHVKIIHVKIGRIYGNQFKCAFLEIQYFFIHFWNLHKILNILWKRWASKLKYFRNYWLRKTWLQKFLFRKCKCNDHYTKKWKAKRSNLTAWCVRLIGFDFIHN